HAPVTRARPRVAGFQAMTRRRPRFVTLAVATALVALAGCGAPLPPPKPRAPEQPPPIGQARPFTLPAKRELTLPNGMRATLVPFGTIPKTALLLTLRTGNVADGPKTGLADLVAEMLKEGAGGRDGEAVARYAAELGGALDASAGPDQMTIAIDVLSDR